MLGRSALLAATNSTTTGFGTRYANPGTLPTSGSAYCESVAFHPSDSAIGISTSVTPWLGAYSWSASGFGAKYADPLPVLTFTNNVRRTRFSPDGNVLAFSGSFGDNTRIRAFAWSASGFGAKYADPSIVTPSLGYGLAFNPSGNAIAISHGSSIFIGVYPWSTSGGFGAKYANPSTLPPDTGNDVAFSPTGNAIAVAHNASPYITVYPWSASGFGVKFANPQTLPTGNARSSAVDFSPNGNAIVVGQNSTPFINAFAWSASGFGAKYANPSTLPITACTKVTFNPTGNAVAVLAFTLNVYNWSQTGFGARYANPQTPINLSNIFDVAFSNANDAIAVVGSGSPYINVYKWKS